MNELLHRFGIVCKEENFEFGETSIIYWVDLCEEIGGGKVVIGLLKFTVVVMEIFYNLEANS